MSSENKILVCTSPANNNSAAPLSSARAGWGWPAGSCRDGGRLARTRAQARQPAHSLKYDFSDLQNDTRHTHRRREHGGGDQRCGAVGAARSRCDVRRSARAAAPTVAAPAAGRAQLLALAVGASRGQPAAGRQALARALRALQKRALDLTPSLCRVATHAGQTLVLRSTLLTISFSQIPTLKPGKPGLGGFLVARILFF